MILIACTHFSRSFVKPFLLAEILEKRGFHIQIQILEFNFQHLDIVVTPDLVQTIKRASLILLFAQPYPLEWEDPFDSYFMSIYSFIYLHHLAKLKTIFITPFVIKEQDEKITTDFMKLLLKKSQLGHFKIYPSDPEKFLYHPPAVETFSSRNAPFETLLNFHAGLLNFCRNKFTK